MKSSTVFNSSSSSSSSSSLLFILFVSCYSLLLSHCVVVVDSFSLSSEREALLSLLNNFSFESSYSIQLNWNNLSSSTPCNWSGVGCNTEKTHVVSLNLYGYEITGQLGPQIGRLKYLKSLDLGYNYLNGSIPTELWNCSHLQHLDLSLNNRFSGQLDPQIGNLRYLKSLHLGYNHFNGSIPTELWNCSHLQHLDLSNNYFTGELPEAVGNCFYLQHLDLSFNNFTGVLPAEAVSNLHQLNYFAIYGNHFTGSIPLSIGNATNMKKLLLSDNSLHGTIPTSISNCTKLETLDLARNGGLSGEIPLGVWRIPTLVDIVVIGNNLSGELPVEMTTGLHHLTDIDLSDNQFSGLIPQALGINNTSLEWVDFSNNNFSGEIPPNLCSGKQLENMDLGQNKLQGSIPSSYTQNCYSLKYLVLRENNLIGTLPHFEKKNSSILSTLDISGNNIHGQIPWSICNLVSTLGILGFSLDLSENQMNGVLPHCLGSSNQLRSLNLRNNDFTGTIPPNFTSDQLDMLDLNGNRFEGKIPRIHSEVLKYLDLGNNQLNDTFPFFWEEMISSDYFEILVLRSNKLYGPLNHFHTHFAFSKLKVLDISGNYFTGYLPIEFFLGLDAMKHIDIVQYTDEDIYYPSTSSVVIYKGKETRLNRTFMDEFRAIDISNNDFQGTIPRLISELVWLKMLNLSNNNLDSCIPSSLGNLTRLESLDLSYNKLSGEIPHHFTYIHSLAVLNLSHNNLTGPIPDGGQFSTFTNDSFSGNSGLCGSQMSRKCGDDANPKNHLDPNEEKQSYEDSNNPWSFDWEPVVIGYGCGVLIGLVIQYFLFTKDFLYRWFG